MSHGPPSAFEISFTPASPPTKDTSTTWKIINVQPCLSYTTEASTTLDASIDSLSSSMMLKSPYTKKKRNSQDLISFLRKSYVFNTTCMDVLFIAFEKRRMSIYCENLTQLKSLQLLLNAMRVDEFYDYIHTNQKHFLTRMASTLDEEDAIQLIYESTRKYDARRIWCLPWVFTMCNQTRAPVQEIIIQRLVTYTGPQFKACSICFDYVPGQEIVKLPCKHLFHKTCIQEYFDSIPSYQTHMMRQYALHVETKCPNCRQPCQKYVKDDFWSLQKIVYNIPILIIKHALAPFMYHDSTPPSQTHAPSPCSLYGLVYLKNTIIRIVVVFQQSSCMVR